MFMTRTHDSRRKTKSCWLRKILPICKLGPRSPPYYPADRPGPSSCRAGADRMMRTLGKCQHYFSAGRGDLVQVRQGSPAILLGSPQLFLVGTGARSQDDCSSSHLQLWEWWSPDQRLGWMVVCLPCCNKQAKPHLVLKRPACQAWVSVVNPQQGLEMLPKRLSCDEHWRVLVILQGP